MDSSVADSFHGGVGQGESRLEDVRARVAVQGSNVHALTGSNDTRRIPLARCTVKREGGKFLVRDDQTSLVIWSDDEEFLDTLARAQHGTLRTEVRRIQQAMRRMRLLKRSVYALLVVAVIGVTSVPLARWAVGGGVSSITDRIGETSLESLALPTGLAPSVEHELDVIAERLRPAYSPSAPTFRVLLAGYTQPHSFSLPPSTVVVTAGLVCTSNRSDIVTAAIARELAHLENRDIRTRLADTVDWDTTLDLAHGDMSRLRAHMLDYANLDRSPGFTADQDATAEQRASAMLTSIGVDPTTSLEDLAQVQAGNSSPEAPKKIMPTAVQPVAGKPMGNAPKGAETFDWLKVRDEACELIGR